MNQVPLREIRTREVQEILFNSPILFYTIIWTYRYLRAERYYRFLCPLKGALFLLKWFQDSYNLVQIWKLGAITGNHS
jgi:hypothetical protein